MVHLISDKFIGRMSGNPALQIPTAVKEKICMFTQKLKKRKM